jgi:hypothetical protein
MRRDVQRIPVQDGGRAPTPPPSGDPAEVHGSEALLEATAACITRILDADSFREALPVALQTIARVVQIDRVVVIEKPSPDDMQLIPATLFVWNSADAPNVDAAAISRKVRVDTPWRSGSVPCAEAKP